MIDNDEAKGPHANRKIILSVVVSLVVLSFVTVYIFTQLIPAFILRLEEQGYIGLSDIDTSMDLDNCTSGDTGFIRIGGSSANITVQGVTAYRGKQACYSKGKFTIDDDRYDMRIYRVDPDNGCIILTSETDSSDTSEKCEGEWPGYVR